MSDDAGKSMRDAKAPSATSLGVGSRWAVVVGVSLYQDSRLNLEFAAEDARELGALIQTPTGGGFPAGNVLLLVDHQATRGDPRAA